MVGALKKKKRKESGVSMMINTFALVSYVVYMGAILLAVYGHKGIEGAVYAVVIIFIFHKWFNSMR